MNQNTVLLFLLLCFVVTVYCLMKKQDSQPEDEINYQNQFLIQNQNQNQNQMLHSEKVRTEFAYTFGMVLAVMLFVMPFLLLIRMEM